MKSNLISVPFHNDNIVAIFHENKPYVAVKPLCESIGLTWGSQYNRIIRDEVLSTCIFITKIQVLGDSQRRDMMFLPAEMLQGWLFGVSVNHARPELRDKLITYKRECFSVLHDYFTKGAAKKPEAQAVHRTGYHVKLTYVNLESGHSETMEGLAGSVEEIITGTASKFGYYIESMHSIPTSARLTWR